MKNSVLTMAFAGLLAAGMGTAMACEYKAGETKFVDYAKCRYGDDAVLVVPLSEGSGWQACVYHVQAVTKEENGKETLSVNDRGQIGNPCYLTKQKCDAALKALQASGGY